MIKNQRLLITLGAFIWLIAACFYMYEFFLRTFIGSVAHQVIPDLHLTAESFALLGSAYYIAYGIMQIPVGILADKFGVKWVMMFATLLCAGSTLIFAHSHSFSMALVSRFGMGIGSSFAFVCLLIIAVTWFPRRYFGFFSGSSQFIGTMGPLLSGGPLIALMNAHHASWRVALSTVALAGIALFILSAIFVQDKPRESGRVLVFLNPEKPLSQSLGKLMRNKQAWSVAIYSALVYVSASLLGAFWGTEYMQTRGLTQASAAGMVSMLWLGFAITCPLLGACSDLLRRRKPMLIAMALIGVVSSTCIVYLPTLKNHLWYDLMFFAIGAAAAGQSLGFATIAEHVDVDTRATALGLNNGAIILCAAIIPPLASYFIEASAHGSSHLVTQNFYIGFAIMPIVFIGAALISLFTISETYCKPQKEMIILRPGQESQS